MMRGVPKYVKALSCRIGHIKTASIFQVVEIRIAYLYALHLVLLGVVRTFIGMASFLYGKHMSARNVGIPVIRPGLVFRIAVPFTRITLHYIADFYNGELRVVKFKLGKIGGKRFYFVCFHEFAQYPTAGNTATLFLFIISISVCVKPDCAAFLNGTQQSDTGGCIHIGNPDGL